MSAITAIDAVGARLAVVAGIGPNVYNMTRAAIDDKSFAAIFTDKTSTPNKVNAWQLTRKATKSADEEMNAMSRTHRIEIRGYMSFQDAITEPIWQQMIETVCAAFDPYDLRRFNGQFDWSGPMLVEDVGLGTLGNVLVHTALLIYPVREFPL